MKNLSNFTLVLIIAVVGTLFRSYGITDHWRTNDHYNYSGSATTHALHCLKTTPLSVSRGLYTFFCDTPQRYFYPNHSSAILFGMWGLTLIFGDAEWVHRLYTLIFSVLNIFLVFLIAQNVWSKGRRPVFAAFFQAFFLGSIYFGTHIDLITECVLSFMLLSTLAAQKEKWGWACFWATFSGLIAWVGFLQFAPLLLLSWVKRRNFKTVLVGSGIGFLFGVGLMMYLLDTWNPVAFLHHKLFEAEYVSTTSMRDKLIFPFAFVKNFFVSQDRLLGALFATLAFYELAFGEARALFTTSRAKLANLSNYHHALILCGGADLVYALIGPKYVMVHIYLYLFALPFFALLCANLFSKIFIGGMAHIAKPKVFIAMGLFFVAFYPYGIFKTNAIHDAITSVVIILSTLIFIFARNNLRKIALVLICVAALANFSQMVNYRNEPDSEYTFCEWAKQEYARTHEPIITHERHTQTKDLLYCRGIPIVYQ